MFQLITWWFGSESSFNKINQEYKRWPCTPSPSHSVLNLPSPLQTIFTQPSISTTNYLYSTFHLHYKLSVLNLPSPLQTICTQPSFSTTNYLYSTFHLHYKLSVLNLPSPLQTICTQPSISTTNYPYSTFHLRTQPSISSTQYSSCNNKTNNDQLKIKD